MGEPGISQWRQLYEQAARLEALAPWKTLAKDCVIELEQGGQLWYAVFPESWPPGPGVCCVRSREGLATYDELRTCAPEQAQGLFFEQDALLLIYRARNKLTRADLRLVSALGLPRLNMRFPCYRSARPNYLPDLPSEEEAAALIRLQRALLEALEALEKGEARLGEGEALRRVETEAGVRYEARPFPRPRHEVEPTHIVDELLIPRLMQRDLVDARLELDLYRVPQPLPAENGRVMLPIGAMLTDSASGSVVGFTLFSPDDDAGQEICELVTNFILKYGRPLILYMQSEKVHTLVSELCERLMIPTELLNFLPATNQIRLSRNLTDDKLPGEGDF